MDSAVEATGYVMSLILLVTANAASGRKICKGDAKRVAIVLSTQLLNFYSEHRYFH